MEPGPNELAFEAALNSSGNISCFLDDFFSFLSRRTDFFIECPKEGGPVGFVEGHAEKMLVSKFKKWQEIHRESKKTLPLEKMTEKIKEKEKTNPTSHSSPQPKIPIPGSSEAKATTATARSSMSDHNGFSTDKYSWCQTINDIDLKINVGPEVKKGKDVIVDIKSDSISVRLSSEKEPIFAGRLECPILKEESMWNLLPGEAVNIWLQKAQERWWKVIIEGETPIDMTKIEAVKPMEDLSEEEQMKIQEMIWKEEQKRKGISVDDDNMQNILKKAWNVEGSPFKGQPFDPSRVNLSNN